MAIHGIPPSVDMQRTPAKTADTSGAFKQALTEVKTKPLTPMVTVKATEDQLSTLAFNQLSLPAQADSATLQVSSEQQATAITQEMASPLETLAHEHADNLPPAPKTTTNPPAQQPATQTMDIASQPADRAIESPVPLVEMVDQPVESTGATINQQEGVRPHNVQADQTPHNKERQVPTEPGIFRESVNTSDIATGREATSSQVTPVAAVTQTAEIRTPARAMPETIERVSRAASNNDTKALRHGKIPAFPDTAGVTPKIKVPGDRSYSTLRQASEEVAEPGLTLRDAADPVKARAQAQPSSPLDTPVQKTFPKIAVEPQPTLSQPLSASPDTNSLAVSPGTASSPTAGPIQIAPVISPATAQLNTQFATDLTGHLVRMVVTSEQQATIKLNPEELGPLTIDLKTADKQVQLSLLVTQAGAKPYMEQALPMLREGLMEAGLDLTDVNVTERQENTRSQGENAKKGTEFIAQSAVEAQTPEDESDVESVSYGVSIYA